MITVPEIVTVIIPSKKHGRKDIQLRNSITLCMLRLIMSVAEFGRTRLLPVLEHGQRLVHPILYMFKPNDRRLVLSNSAIVLKYIRREKWNIIGHKKFFYRPVVAF